MLKMAINETDKKTYVTNGCVKYPTPSTTIKGAAIQ